MSLLQKLLEIQKQVEHFTKDQAGHNYKYATGEQVLGKIRPLMNEHGLLLKQEVLEVENQKIEYQTKHGNKAEMFTSVKQLFTWIDTESGEEMQVRWHANGMNDWDKGLGSSLTYAERYFLLKFFHVPTDGDDPDARQESRSAARNGRPDTDDLPWLNKTISPDSEKLTEDWKNVTKALKEGKATVKDVYKKFKVNKTLNAELQKLESAS